MIKINDNVLYNIARFVCEAKKYKEQSANIIKQKKDVETTYIVDRNDWNICKINITMECNDIISKNMDSGKVNPQPVMCFLQDKDNNITEVVLNERTKKAEQDSKLYGITSIEIAFNDIKELKNLSDMQMREYHLLWIEAAISYIKYLLNNKQLKIEYPKQSILNNIHKEIETARKER
ncbi:hypothetical protein HDR60_03490 [bacterium]|nr:hypothetical protein [bacterium]